MEGKVQESKHILVVGSSILSSKLREIHSSIRTSVICRSSELPFLHRAQGNEAIIVVKDEADISTWIEHAMNLHKTNPFDHITSFEELDQDKASDIAKALNLPFHSSDTVLWAIDKYEMRKRLRDLEFDDIPAMLVHSAEDIKRFANKYDYPLILKPSRGKSSTGITVIKSEGEIFEAFYTSENATAPRLDQSILMVEPLLIGQEFSVEVISENGEHFIIGIVEKHVDEESKVEIGHVFPAEIPKNIEKEIYDYTLRFLDTLNISHGVTHTDIIYTKDGPKIIETHLCPAGDKVPELIKDSIGIDCIKYLVELEAGVSIKDRIQKQLTKTIHNRKSSAIWYSYVNFDGILETIQNKKEIQEMEGVTEFSQLISDGIHVSKLRSSYSRIAFVRTINTHAEQALSIAQAAIKDLAMFLSIRGQPF